MKVAIVHYWLVSYRGGEQVLRHILECVESYFDSREGQEGQMDQVDVYTLFCRQDVLEQVLPQKKIKRRVYTSVLNIPFFRRHYQKFFFLYPLGIRSLHLRENYDLLISSESGPAKGIANPKRIPHICYVHTPMRYCYGFTRQYTNSLPVLLRPVVHFLFWLLRKWDQTTIDNVDLYIANSENVRRRVARYFARQAQTCYPAIRREWFLKSENENENEGEVEVAGENESEGSTLEFLREESPFYLSVGALVPYKRIDMLVDYFLQQEQSQSRGQRQEQSQSHSQSARRLLIVGSGSEEKKLRRRITHASNICMLGQASSLQIRQLFLQAQAFLFPGEEDFGLTVVEAMSQGLPVIAYAKGGALETVQFHKKDLKKSTGILFAQPTIDSLHQSIVFFEKNRQSFDAEYIRKQALVFHPDRFQEQMRKFISSHLQKNGNAN